MFLDYLVLLENVIIIFKCIQKLTLRVKVSIRLRMNFYDKNSNYNLGMVKQKIIKLNLPGTLVSNVKIHR